MSKPRYPAIYLESDSNPMVDDIGVTLRPNSENTIMEKEDLDSKTSDISATLLTILRLFIERKCKPNSDIQQKTHIFHSTIPSIYNNILKKNPKTP